MAPGSRGVGAVFVHFSDVDSGQTGNAIGEPRVPRRSRSHYLSNAPGIADQLVPDLRKSELGLVRYGPANRGHRGVFGPFEGSFPIGIPAGPDKFLAIREFLVVHECVLFPMCPGSQINLLRVKEDSVRKRGNVGGKIPELSAKPYFVGLFSRAWPCTEAILGSQDMILRTEAIGMFLMPRGHLLTEIPDQVAAGRRESLRKRCLPKGLFCQQHFAQNLAKGGQFDPVFGLVNGPVKPWSTWSWSNLVELGQSSPNSWRCIPELHFKGFRVRWILVGSETARSNLGQTSVNPSQTWSTLVKLGRTSGNVSRTFFLGVFDAAKCRQIVLVRFGLSRFAHRHLRKSRGLDVHSVGFYQSPHSRKGIGSPGKHLHAPLDLHGCEGRRVDSRVPCPRYKRVRGGACTSPAPPESGFDPKVQ
uniref:Uncharacterized protein n=1 Tax=Fagus sylvatica TaxID=28930 RepID=A0A2N9GGH6_FAGSY